VPQDQPNEISCAIITNQAISTSTLPRQGCHNPDRNPHDLMPMVTDPVASRRRPTTSPSSACSG